MNRWTRIQTPTAMPRASLTTSPGVSQTDQMLSFCGILTRTVTTSRVAMNTARRTIAAIRSLADTLAAGAAEPGDWRDAAARSFNFASMVVIPRAGADAARQMTQPQRRESLKLYCHHGFYVS